MKRCTTPTLPVKIGMAVDTSEIKYAEFIFKNEKSTTATTLLYKTYAKPNIPFGEIEADSFTVMLPFTFEETESLPAGKVYMDTKIELNDGTIPETEIVCIYVNDTLFNESELG